MKNLITGGAGFIGSHLSEHLLSKNESVIILDDFSSGKSMNIDNLSKLKNVKIVNGSILNQELVMSLMSQVNVCYHLAASLGVERINSDPISTFEINVKGSEIVLNAASKNNVRTFLASSSEIYGKNIQMPLAENSDRVLGSPQVARWSYSEAKAIDELISFQLNKNDLFPVTIGRLFNTVGTRQSGQYGMVLPRFINAALNNLPLVVYGDGTQTRSFCSVSDVVIAIAGLISTSKTIGQVYNIGSNAELSIHTLAKLVLVLTNSKSEILFKDSNKVFGENFEEPLRRVPDTSKITKEIGWLPQKEINEIINEIIEFEKNHEI